VEKYQVQIYRLSLNFTGNHHDAEDVLQDVLLKAYRSLPKFRGDSGLGTWLHRITINTCLDRGRRCTIPTVSSDETPSDSSRYEERSAGTNPERRAEAALIQAHIERALRRLTPMERAVFVLRSYDQLSIKEVSGMLGRSQGTIKNILWRALKKLQQELAFYRKELGLEGPK
jgi:RNA polymerase sigma-70 factor (ECF subfamily)